MEWNSIIIFIITWNGSDTTVGRYCTNYEVEVMRDGGREVGREGIRGGFPPPNNCCKIRPKDLNFNVILNFALRGRVFFLMSITIIHLSSWIKLIQVLPN